MIEILNHYRKLSFFLFNRFKADNYLSMRQYLSQVLIDEIEKFMSLKNKKVLDVGGAKGEFCEVISKMKQCDATNYEPYPGDYIWPKTKVGFADDIKFSDEEFDLVICRGVMEHIPTDKQQKSINEMYRVTKKEGLCYIMIPPWYNLHAGHKLKPFHIFPFKIAKFLRHLFFNNKIATNSYTQQGLYPITFRKMLKLIKLSHFKLLAAKDTHLRLHFLTKIPLLREIMIPAVAFILIKEKVKMDNCQ